MSFVLSNCGKASSACLLPIRHNPSLRLGSLHGTTSRIETTQSEPWLIFVCTEGFDEARYCVATQEFRVRVLSGTELAAAEKQRR